MNKKFLSCYMIILTTGFQNPGKGLRYGRKGIDAFLRVRSFLARFSNEIKYNANNQFPLALEPCLDKICVGLKYRSQGVLRPNFKKDDFEKPIAFKSFSFGEGFRMRSCPPNANDSFSTLLKLVI